MRRNRTKKSKAHGRARWPSGTITQPAIAPRQAPAQTLLVLSSNPTRNRPSLGRTSFIFSHYRLPDHVSKTPTNTVTSFLNSTLLSQHQQAITEKSSNHVTQSCHGARLAAASWPLAAAARSGARKNGRGQWISHPVQISEEAGPPAGNFGPPRPRPRQYPHP